MILEFLLLLLCKMVLLCICSLLNLWILDIYVTPPPKKKKKKRTFLLQNHLPDFVIFLM